MWLDNHFVKKIVPEAELLGKELPQEFSCSIDTRSITPGQIFCALRGTRDDGHDFIKEAVAKGAAGIMIDKDKRDCIHQLPSALLGALSIIIVPDVECALYSLASAWRLRFNIPVIGITGSIG
ncbi:MAG TPA: Mur ligase domain-containing protein, partial [Candidatus Babeliaceae bacterium]|nr:Mur ligase domain-containing protein [Candidatus Babeliaceae bacterium]